MNLPKGFGYAQHKKIIILGVWQLLSIPFPEDSSEFCTILELSHSTQVGVLSSSDGFTSQIDNLQRYIQKLPVITQYKWTYISGWRKIRNSLCVDSVVKYIIKLLMTLSYQSSQQFASYGNSVVVFKCYLDQTCIFYLQHKHWQVVLFLNWLIHKLHFHGFGDFDDASQKHC